MNSKPLTKVQQTRYNLINGLRNDAIESIEKIKAKLDGRTFNAYKTKIMSSNRADVLKNFNNEFYKINNNPSDEKLTGKKIKKSNVTKQQLGTEIQEKAKKIYELSLRTKLIKSLQKTDKQLLLKDLQKKVVDKKYKTEEKKRKNLIEKH